MTTLNEQITQLEQELALNKNASNVHYILGEYEAIRSSFADVNTSLNTILEHYRVLKNLPEDAPSQMIFSDDLKQSAKKARFSLKAFTDRWAAEAHQARQGNELARATEILNSTLSSCQKEAKDCWKSWIQALQQMVTVEEARLANQMNIPGQKQIVTDFIKERKRFNDLKKRLPDQTDVIMEIIQLQENMTALKGQMKFDLPPDVDAFFKELDALSNDVSLDFLTSDVLQWLKDNHMLGDFIVTRKGTV